MPYTEEEVLELAKRAYRSGDASFEIERAHCALLVIDMQNEFVRPMDTVLGGRRRRDEFPRFGA
jgi:isochorismate hydrolase